MRSSKEPSSRKLDLIKRVPLLYDEFLARLELDGLSESGHKDPVQVMRFNQVLDFFVYRLSLESLEIY